MALSIGTQLGSYEITGLLGKGGMGEVYRARDKRLGREVAIKVLSAEVAKEADRMRRLEQEARAAGRLSHPNILVVHDVGTHEGSPYIVSELLEGETLRERIGQHPLPLRKAIDFSLQLARGLAAAHDKQIVHRDLKPENLFVTNDGRLKILDFGLAKLLPQAAGTLDSNAPTGAGETAPGMIMGTVGYMSPEQVRGQDADHRSDIFAFGAILYEMLSGKRAFWGETPAEVMTAILKDDPPELSDVRHEIGPDLKRIVHHCLEKKPDERFQSASDIAFSIESLSVPGAARPQVAAEPAPAWRRGWSMPAVLILAALILGALAGIRVSSGGKAALPSYERLTFNRGTIWNARFTPDGQNVVYSARWDGRPLDVFAARVGKMESRSLKLDNTDVLSVSASNEMLVLRNRQPSAWYVARGTLARMPVDGGVPREILEDVQEADWAPDGSTLAVVRWVNGQNQLEYPVGKVLYKTTGYLSHPRISPKGDLVAFMDHQIQWDNRGWVAVVDLTGKKTVLSGEWQGEEGLAWSPPGLQLLPTGAGELRQLERGGIEQYARTVGWFPDGKRVVFQGREPGHGWRFYGQSIEGGPPQPITPEGTRGIRGGVFVSPDGRWVIGSDSERHVSLYPVAGGAPQPLEHLDGGRGIVGWSSDGRSLYLSETEETSIRVYRFDPLSGRKELLQEIRPADPAGIWSTPSIFLTPDAKDYVYSVRRILSDLYIANGLK